VSAYAALAVCNERGIVTRFMHHGVNAATMARIATRMRTRRAPPLPPPIDEAVAWDSGTGLGTSLIRGRRSGSARLVNMPSRVTAARSSNANGRANSHSLKRSLAVEVYELSARARRHDRRFSASFWGARLLPLPRG
jgi:hypothetical protein